MQHRGRLFARNTGRPLPGRIAISPPPPPRLSAIACRLGQAQGVRMGLVDIRCKVAARGVTLASRRHAFLPPSYTASCAL